MKLFLILLSLLSLVGAIYLFFLGIFDVADSGPRRADFSLFLPSVASAGISVSCATLCCAFRAWEEQLTEAAQLRTEAKEKLKREREAQAATA
jgi:hypothetical protein